MLLENDTVTEMEIKSTRSHKSQILLCFKGVTTRSEAEKLVGRYLAVSEADLLELPEDTYYHFELVGMKVYTEEGRCLGEIAEVLSLPANDAWRISGEKEFLLPAIADVVLNVDKKEKRVTIRLMKGLIEE